MHTYGSQKQQTDRVILDSSLSMQQHIECWNFCSQELSLPRAKMSWNFRSRERKCGGTFFSQDRDGRRPNRLVCALILARMTTAAPCLLDYTIPHCAPTYTSRSAARLVENFRLRDPRTSLLDLGLGLIKHIIPQPLPIPLRQRIAYF